MPTQTIWLRASRCNGLLLVACMFAGCSSTNVYYAAGQAPVTIPAREGNYENPDNYRVATDDYPSYIAKYTFDSPPPRQGTFVSKIPNIEILPMEIWRVTHKVGNKLLIFSDAYQDRQCNHLLEYGTSSGAFKDLLSRRCSADYLYHLIVFPDGRVDGWMLLRNPAGVAFSKDRYTLMDPGLRAGPGWPDQPLFEPVVRSK